MSQTHPLDYQIRTGETAPITLLAVIPFAYVHFTVS